MPRPIGSRGEQERNKCYTERLEKTRYFPRMLARLQSAPTKLERILQRNYAQRSTTTFFCVKKSTASQL